jgi:hypothetical protein
MPTTIKGIIDNDHEPVAQLDNLDKFDVIVVKTGSIEKRVTVDHFVNSDDFKSLGTPEERNRLVINTALDAGGDFSASARRFAKSGHSFVK